jgi:hypothetical protein
VQEKGGQVSFHKAKRMSHVNEPTQGEQQLQLPPFRMMWPPASIMPAQCGNHHAEQHPVLIKKTTRVNLCDFSKPKIATTNDSNEGDSEQERDLYFEQGGLKILPDKIIFDKTIYTDHSRDTQKLLALHLQLSCQEQQQQQQQQGCVHYRYPPISVKEWANSSQQRDTLRLRLRCRNAKCSFQFQINWDCRAEHWYISRRRCGNFEHSCCHRKINVNTDSTCIPAVARTATQHPKAGKAGTNKRKGSNAATATMTKRRGESSKAARIIVPDENSKQINHYTGGLNMSLPGLDQQGSSKIITSELRDHHHHLNQFSDLSTADSMEEDHVVNSKQAPPIQIVGGVAPPNDGATAVESLMALSGKASVASATAVSFTSPPPIALTWTNQATKHDDRHGNDKSRTCTVRIPRTSQAFADFIQAMPEETRAKLAAPSSSGIVYRARIDQDGLVFEPAYLRQEHVSVQVTTTKRATASSSSSSSSLSDGDDTARHTREPFHHETATRFGQQKNEKNDSSIAIPHHRHPSGVSVTVVSACAETKAPVDVAISAAASPSSSE